MEAVSAASVADLAVESALRQAGDDVAVLEAAQTAFSKCVYDPGELQRAANVAHCGVANPVDWSKAHWDHPIMQQLKLLSPLSSYDMPLDVQRTAAGFDSVADSQKEIPSYTDAVRAAVAQLSPAAQKVHFLPSRAVPHDSGCAAVASPRYAGRPVALISREHTSAVEAEARRLSAVRESKAVPTSVSATRMLVHLSSETIANDPDLQRLVGSVAQHYREDPEVNRAVVLKHATSLPPFYDVDRAKSAVDGTRTPSGAASPYRPTPAPNRGFHASDIVAFPETSADERWAETSPTRHRSMHDVGVVTATQRHMDEGSVYDDAFVEYKSTLTSLQGHCVALERRAMAYGIAESKAHALELLRVAAPEEGTVPSSPSSSSCV